MSDLFSPPVLLALSLTVLAAATTMLGALAICGAARDHTRLLAFGLSFAGGAMIYISLVEIFVKSNTAFAEVLDPKTAYAAATVAFFGGVLALVLLDRFIPNPHAEMTPPSEAAQHTNALRRTGILTMAAITAHNFPEGMATFFATLDHPTVGAALAAAIAVHNIPEGISIAIPVYYATGSRAKAFGATFLSAIAEPIGAVGGYLVLAPFLSPSLYGIVFGGIAGAMVYLALDELLPQAQRYAKGHETVYGMVMGMGIIALSLVMFK